MFQLKQVFITSFSVSGDADASLNLRVTIASDGSAQMDGAILVVSALDGPMSRNDPGSTRRLVAHGTNAQARCADADGDGHAGIVQIAADFEDAHSRETVRIVLQTEPTRDIDEDGTYLLTLVIGDERWLLDARISLEPTQRRRKHRPRRRNARIDRVDCV
jgi:hypothetical protein